MQEMRKAKPQPMEQARVQCDVFLLGQQQLVPQPDPIDNFAVGYKRDWNDPPAGLNAAKETDFSDRPWAL